MQPALKNRNLGIQINNTDNTSEEKNLQFYFLKKKPSAAKHSPTMFIIWNFIIFFFLQNSQIELSLTGIVNLKFTRGNEI